MKEEFEDTKGVIRIRMEEQTTRWPKRKRTKGQTTKMLLFLHFECFHQLLFVVSRHSQDTKPDNT
jgi:hypothetical protein